MSLLESTFHPTSAAPQMPTAGWSTGKIALGMGGALLLVSGMIFAVFAWYGTRAVTPTDRDEARVEQIQMIRKNLLRAEEDRLLFVGCAAGSPLSACRLCRSERCRPDEEFTQTYLPSAFFASDEGLAPCTRLSSESCALAIEQEGDLPLTLQAYQLRFFLETGTEAISTPGPHLLNGFGRFE